MVIALPPRLLQLPDLPFIQLPPHRSLKLLGTDLLPSLLLLRSLQLRLKPRLHSYPKRSIERDRLCIAPNLR